MATVTCRRTAALLPVQFFTTAAPDLPNSSPEDGNSMSRAAWPNGSGQSSPGGFGRPLGGTRVMTWTIQNAVAAHPKVIAEHDPVSSTVTRSLDSPVRWFVPTVCHPRICAPLRRLRPRTARNPIGDELRTTMGSRRPHPSPSPDSTEAPRPLPAALRRVRDRVAQSQNSRTGNHRSTSSHGETSGVALARGHRAVVVVRTLLAVATRALPVSASPRAAVMAMSCFPPTRSRRRRRRRRVS